MLFFLKIFCPVWGRPISENIASALPSLRYSELLYFVGTVGILVMYWFSVVINAEEKHSWTAMYNLLFCGKSPLSLYFLRNNYGTSVLQSMAAVLSKITTTNIAALIVGLTCIVLLLIGKEINLRFKKKLPVPIPMEIIVVSQPWNSIAKLYNYSIFYQALLSFRVTSIEHNSFEASSSWRFGYL